MIPDLYNIGYILYRFKPIINANFLWYTILQMESVMQTIDIGDFKANLLKYLEMAGSGEQFLVASNGKPLAKITAPRDKKDIAKKQLRALAVTAKIRNVIAPAD